MAPPAVESLVTTKLETLATQFQAVADRQDLELEARSCQIALLPDAKMLDRQQRYESAAEHSLYRAIEQLARLRGTTIERITASMTYVRPDGTTVQVTGERTTVRHPPEEPIADETP